MTVDHIIQGDCLNALRQLPDKSIQTCVTSPPYWGLRDYGMDEQIGLEQSPEEYVNRLCDVFDEVKRVLRDDGTLWLNLGDSYSNHKDCKSTVQSIAKGTNAEVAHVIEKGKSVSRNTKMLKQSNLKNKDLVGIPWMVAFELRKRGWYLRQDIIWHKPNPMPESVTDRCTKSHEYIFLLAKNEQYFYDANAIKQPMADISLVRLSQDIDAQKGSNRVPGKSTPMKAVGQFVGGKKHKNMDETGHRVHSFHQTRNSNSQEWQSEDGKANKRSVWTVTTKPFNDAHFATFPEDLISDCIKAGAPEEGIVLDPFMGAGTTAVVCKKLNRRYVGIELNPEYIAIAKRRLRQMTIFEQL